MRFGILPLLVLVESVIGLEDGSIRQKEKDLTELRSLDRGRRQASSDIVNGGCYEDKPARMLTGKGELHLANNSPNACNSYCQGFKYYGVQYTNQCFCGDTLHHLVKKPENECNAECPGDSSKKCGGTWRQNLYKTSPETCPEEIFVRLSNDPNRHAQYAGKYVINGTSNHHAYYVKPPHAIHVHNSQKWTIGLILGLPLGNIMSTTIAACPTAEGLEWQYRDAGGQWQDAGEDVKILSVNAEDGELLYSQFPQGFMWGAGTSSYQVEGGWNEDGKGLSNWDVWANTTGNVIDGSDGRVACDSYHKFKQDVALVAGMGLNVYRFSLAWSRIIPDGTGEVNMAGIKYYQDLLQECKNHGIRPLVDLFHNDMPYGLESERGGWLNPDSADWFKDYADVCFKYFGKDVPMWTTFNEPQISGGWELGDWPPGKSDNKGRDFYIVYKNILMAHAKAYRLYERKYAGSQGGRVGISIFSHWYEPKNNQNPQDVKQSEKCLQFDFGLLASPIFKGAWPKMIKDSIDARSRDQSFSKSRLPTLSDEEWGLVRGTADFLGLNSFTSYLVEPMDFPISEISTESDLGAKQTQDETWLRSGSSWLAVMPQGMRKILNWIKNEYNNPPVIVTENGFSDNLGNLDDLQRIYYLKHYINNVLKAIQLDGCDVQGYMAWSLLDNFEWTAGYTQKFGLVSVDFDSPDRTRTAKESSKFLAKLAQDNGFVE